MKIKLILCLIIFASLLSIGSLVQAQTGIVQAMFPAQGHFLTLAILDDDLAHFALSSEGNIQAPLWTSPMIIQEIEHPGPSTVTQPSPNVFETPAMRLEIDEATLCITVTDLARDPELLLTTTCPLRNKDESLGGLTLTKEGTTDVYGLGEQFQRRGGTEGNWFGKRRNVLNQFGNELAAFNGGNVGNAQFPIMYALGQGTDNYALFLDDVYQHLWDFSGDPFSVHTTNTVVRWYIMTGPDLADLRRDYMELTGTPPVPPKQMFGLWVSEYGYENWDELNRVRQSMQSADFPQDGFVLDLQWFGGITGPDGSQMGSLAWDIENFPDPAGVIADLRAEYGLGVMVIEEPYVSNDLSDYDQLAADGVLVRKCAETTCEPVKFTTWWGSGSMVDWTNPEAAAAWHESRRAHLIDEGVIGHWTDLGEPENFMPSAWYYGLPEFDLHGHADVHNLYNLLWSRSIWEAYQADGLTLRPFIMSRSGTSGSQRYGVSMWSGDIGANMPSLAAHMNVQMQMSLSGVDYFGSDVGGFYRQAADLKISKEDMYTVWLANSALLDVPLRPHASNVQNAFQTAPSLNGDVSSNLENVRLRYELSPYLYTLAHRAYRNADPVFGPLVYYFQSDPNVRTLGNQKMIGPDLMMAAITGEDIETVSVYLPAGGWFNYYTDEFIDSTGEWIDVPTMVDGVRRAPLFARDGAIIPQMHVDDQTLNVLGQREDGSFDNTLRLAVYHASQDGQTMVIDDDGETMAYQDSDFWQTPVTSAMTNRGRMVTIGALETSSENAPTERPVEIRLTGSTLSVKQVTLNGDDIEFTVDESGVIHVTTDVLPVTEPLVFAFIEL